MVTRAEVGRGDKNEKLGNPKEREVAVAVECQSIYNLDLYEAMSAYVPVWVSVVQNLVLCFLTYFKIILWLFYLAIMMNTTF